MSNRRQVLPDPTLKRSANSGPLGLTWWYPVRSPQPRSGALLPSPSWLERQAA